jgi:hypothetical protein
VVLVALGRLPGNRVTLLGGIPLSWFPAGGILMRGGGQWPGAGGQLEIAGAPHGTRRVSVGRNAIILLRTPETVV